jgi:hypothetical protein
VLLGNVKERTVAVETMLLCRKCHSGSGCANAKWCEKKFTFGPVSYGLCDICHNRDFMGANADQRQECVKCTSGD